MATKVQSKRSLLLARVLDWINSGTYDDQTDYILFGRNNICDLIVELTDRDSTPDAGAERMRRLVSDIAREVGRKVDWDRTSIGRRPRVKSLRGRRLSSEQVEAFEWFVRNADTPDPSSVIDAKYAHEIVAKLPKIVDRATRLSPHKVDANAISEPSIGRHFEEAHSCYLYGFKAACAVLCRAILESALRAKYDPEGKIEINLPKGHSLFKELLKRAHLPDDLPTWAEKVKQAGDDAAHPYKKGRVRYEQELEEVLYKTRAILAALYPKQDAS